MTIKQKCNCKHDYQDKKYGEGIRVMNVAGDGKTAKCTVCGKEYQLKSEVKK